MVGYQAESIEAATFQGLKETLLRSGTGGCEAANSDQTENHNQDDGEEPLQLLGNQISDLDLLYIGLALTSAEMIGDDGAGEKETVPGWTGTSGVTAAIMQALIAAKYNGAQLTVAKDLVFRETNKTPEFLKKLPLGKVPAFEKSDGVLLTKSKTIACSAHHYTEPIGHSHMVKDTAYPALSPQPPVHCDLDQNDLAEAAQSFHVLASYRAYKGNAPASADSISGQAPRPGPGRDSDQDSSTSCSICGPGGSSGKISEQSGHSPQFTSSITAGLNYRTMPGEAQEQKAVSISQNMKYKAVTMRFQDAALKLFSINLRRSSNLGPNFCTVYNLSIGHSNDHTKPAYGDGTEQDQLRV